MKTQELNQSTQLNEYAYSILQQNFKKVIKQEEAVLADQDPEALHQMRVGMRRLRTALQIFETVVEIPKVSSIDKIGKISKSLGKARDLDVLIDNLKTHYQPALTKSEQEAFKSVLKRLAHQRQKAVHELQETIESSRYQKFKEGFYSWLAQPVYQPIAQFPIQEALPDLLMPLVNQLLLHPGWLVGTTELNGKIQTLDLSTQKLQEVLDQQGTLLHELRKQMKRVRYQTEFFVDCYDSEFATQIQDFKSVQELLGEIQDSNVLTDFFQSELEINLPKEFPSLTQQIRAAQAELWQIWKPIQERYLDSEFRRLLRSRILAVSIQERSP